MDLNQLRVFIKVVDHGSFTRAAIELRQPKSRVSRRISGLEANLGVALLYRTSRQLSLTDAGRRLYEESRGPVLGLENAMRGLQKSELEVRDSLCVTTTDDIGATLLPPVIAELGALYPKLIIDLILTDDVVDIVHRGVDVAIRAGHLKDASLKVKPLGQVAFILVASPGYLDRAAHLATLGDLKHHAALVFSPVSTGDTWVLTNGGKLKSEAPKLNVVCRSDNSKVLLDLTMAGRGVSLLPEFLCLEAIQSGDLVRVLEPLSTPRVPIQFVWPAQNGTNRKARVFIDLAMKRLRRFF